MVAYERRARGWIWGGFSLGWGRKGRMVRSGWESALRGVDVDFGGRGGRGER